MCAQALSKLSMEDKQHGKLRIPALHTNSVGAQGDMIRALGLLKQFENVAKMKPQKNRRGAGIKFANIP